MNPPHGDDNAWMFAERVLYLDSVDLKVINHRPLTIEQRLQITDDSLGGAVGAKLTWISQGMPLDISKQTRPSLSLFA